MSTPLTRPTPTPTASAVKIMPPAPKLWVATVVHQTPASAMIAPTDRSMPPPMITKVMPTVTTPIADACCRIVKTLLPHPVRVAVELGPGDRADDDQDDQHADQAEVAPQRLARRRRATSLPARPAAGRPAPAVRRRSRCCRSCRLPFQQRPRHDEVEHRVFVEFAGRRLVDRPGPRASPAPGRPGRAPRAPRWRPAARRRRSSARPRITW